MGNICIYAPDCTDFTNYGLTVLNPYETTVSWQQAGRYEMELVHPIDDAGKWKYIVNGAILKASIPVRESPIYEYSVEGGEGDVVRNIWEVTGTSTGLYLRTGWGKSTPHMGYYKNGVRVIETDRRTIDGRIWIQCVIQSTGKAGYMSTRYLKIVETITEHISGGRPETHAVLQNRQNREQLFRIVSVETDTETGEITATARHIFYDLAADIIREDYKPENVNAAEAIQHIKSKIDPETPFAFFTEGMPQDVTITGEYGWQNPVEALCDPDSGIIAQAKCQMIRDNYDIHFIAERENDMGVCIRRGKNLIGVRTTNDASNIVSTIIPCGKDMDGKPLWLSDNETERGIDSPNIASHAVKRTSKIDYDVQIVKSGADNEKTFPNNASGKKAARAKLRELAEQDFANGADAPDYSMEVDFVALQNTEASEDIEKYMVLQSVHPYDTVTVEDTLIGLTAKLRVVEFEWNPLNEQYESITLGEPEKVEQTVYSYNLPNGSISGTKLLANSTPGEALRNATIEYAKISNAAIESLNAQSIVALTARINDIVAGRLTTDELYAAIAEIVALKVGTITASEISTDKLAAALAQVQTIIAGTATFDKATIQHLVAEAMHLRYGVGDDVFIENLAVGYAQMVGATIGELCIKASNGDYYILDINESTGAVTATQVSPSPEEQGAGHLQTGQVIVESSMTVGDLNTGNLMATFALINKIDAARIDVDQIFARQAFVNALYTSRIYGGKSLQMIAGEIDVLQIGGQNLLCKEQYDAAQNIDVSSESGYGFKREGIAYDVPIFGQIGSLSLSPDADYTLSFTAWIDANDPNAKQGLVVDLYPDTLPQYDYTWDNGITPTPTRYQWSFRSSSADMSSCFLRFFNDRATTYDGRQCYQLYTIYITDIQLEKGTRATGWTMAPEDLDKVTVYSGTEPPPNPLVGKVWLDQSVIPNMLRRWDGAEWLRINDPQEIWNAQDNLQRQQDALLEEQKRLAMAFEVKQDGTHLHRSVEIGQTPNMEVWTTDAEINFMANNRRAAEFSASYIKMDGQTVVRVTSNGMIFGG